MEPHTPQAPDNAGPAGQGGSDVVYVVLDCGELASVHRTEAGAVAERDRLVAEVIRNMPDLESQRQSLITYSIVVFDVPVRP